MICPLKENNWIEPILAVSRVINIIQWDNTSILRLKKLFTKLPPVRVRMIPLHRFEYNVGLTYLILYQQSIKSSNFSLRDFLNDFADGKALKRRVKILVLSYCLGLITANPQQQT